MFIIEPNWKEHKYILHLNQYRYGHIRPRTVAPFQTFRIFCEWFQKHQRLLGKIPFIFKRSRTRREVLKWPTDESCKQWGRENLGNVPRNVLGSCDRASWNVGWREINQQDATNPMFIIKLLSQHVSGIIMPIIRRTRPCVTAYGVLHCNRREGYDPVPHNDSQHNQVCGQSIIKLPPPPHTNTTCTHPTHHLYTPPWKHLMTPTPHTSHQAGTIHQIWQTYELITNQTPRHTNTHTAIHIYTRHTHTHTTIHRHTRP